MVARHLRHLAAERACTRANDAAVRGDAVRLGDGGSLVERCAELSDLGVEVGVQRQLLGDDQRRDEDDARAAVGGEAATEVERVLGLVAAEERDDDRPIAHRGRAAGEALGAATDGGEIRASHRSSW
jgi:hypothetical protein